MARVRHLDENGRARALVERREEGNMMFGYGRRVCPGRHVVEGTLLWTMQFERPNGSRGELDVRNYVQPA